MKAIEREFISGALQRSQNDHHPGITFIWVVKHVNLDHILAKCSSLS